MLEDRDYMRQPDYRRPQLSFTVALLAVNAAVFLVELVVPHSLRTAEIENGYFALSLDGLKQGFVWQLLTFQFMHAGLWHLLFNSLAIYFFGRPVETILGHGRFLTLYLSAGTFGGLMQMLFALLLPQYFDAPVVGASAGASGLVAAFAMLYWTERFTLLIYFIPVSMRGKTLLWVIFGLALIGLMTPNSNVANAAHLGGILTGVIFIRQFVQGRWPWGHWGASATHPDAPREFVVTRAGKGKFWRSAAGKPDEELSTDEFLKNEVDPILEKISAHGIQSLTAREREILEKARSKMAKR
jgi:membrane associated rhomboid family serine protease